MAGDAIEDLGRGLDMMLATLRSDPYAIETALISLITFSGDARQDVALTEVLSFPRPKLKVRPGTALGAALRLVKRCIEREVITTSQTTKGDYKPLVFLLTDGQPTDEWESVAKEIQSTKTPWGDNLIAIACGPDADTDVLRRFSSSVFLMKDMAPEAWRKVMVWMTQSVQARSHSVGHAPEGEAVQLPDPPADALERAPAVAGTRDPSPRQLFLHAWCSQDQKPYLMRFARSPQSEKYIAVKAHPLEAVEVDPGQGQPQVNSSLLDGCPICPYCGNTAAGSCDCGVLMCIPGSPELRRVKCPRCPRTALFAPGGGSGDLGGSFDITQAIG